MNAQHKINRIGNRVRRLARRLIELNADKTHEIIMAEKSKREPNLSGIYAAISRMEKRLRELVA